MSHELLCFRNQLTKQNPADYFYSAAAPRSRGALWPIFAPARIHLARVYGERKRNFVGQHFWARGYFVSTVGRDENVIRDYIRNQEEEDQRLDQMNMWR